jgi:regulator of replication initiation timing
MLTQFTQISLTLSNLRSNVSALLKERESLILKIEQLTKENEQLKNDLSKQSTTGDS